MNRLDSQLHRLLRGAARARRLETGTVSPAAQMRVLAAWKRSHREAGWTELARMWRRGLALACGLGLAVAAASLLISRQPALDEWTIGNWMANLALRQ